MLLRSSAVQRIAVVRALNLGDMLCAVPALRALRAAFPRAHVTLIALPWATALKDRFDAYVDEIVEFPGYPGIPERDLDATRTKAFLAEMQARSFDLAVQLHGDGSVMNGFVAQLGAARVLAFKPRGVVAVSSEDKCYVDYPDGPEVRRLLSLIAALGVPAADERLEFPLKPSDMQAARALLDEAGWDDGAYACVHPGSSAKERRWPSRSFAQVGDGLERLRLNVVLTGTAAERELVSEVALSMRRPALNLAGRSDLGALAGLLAGARLLISNDTGVAHLGAALQVPSVVVFSGSDPARWAPSNQSLHRALGCGLPDGGSSTFVEGADVSPGDVIEAASELVGVPA